ncbi:UDP-N-acetylmuramoyl-tripeptide--D-alanyl-D-alanine ligase [Flavobacterium aquatile]|uniref:UDP-N-acetylmuramoyl-tripeptide--D-alanyl-D-alanine ligase n=1 Tax=Flavobacterium aquatile LMG 4008 = ATCC 11947 TaxID=1453498 RepID=A0A095STT1_9FLAO|nr:UDP-N-acetylmuramoyl-tripeptide--D-alanyl-D-alanine ligase [Flavobacterium aquatile]KGD67997.1 UDP-N-acetylmuramoyl-tripeptide--D-alanyl-D-alanine ligase [Flavobacterium aquatile LMG 4008 = ATCC 11947]OXA68235.1 UDP-N-acetylmuramoyl-tripeptide--D-alanyl-D-alanine ligase [Flavobacterium aquatile LMG 4008 = ATCC 11947]GEC79861.1 UDP-N-acetylmuramoyl-tripeptide--D-alanyl-D-alanine ligase [Flavobacterium aquatile]
MTIQEIHQLFLKCTSISIDTRKIQSNSLFVAIRGEKFDANTFAKEALEKGAQFVIIDNSDFYIDDRTILVEDSLKALQELAKFHRRHLKLPIIALTGSNGKTTTKELIHVVLAKKYKTKATVGNLNNHIGVPLTLLSFNESTEFGIVEMGANHQREIEFLCSIAEPDFGYITNFGKAHLEGFGGVEGVIKGKSEMYKFLEFNKKIAFVNLDDSIQEEKSRNIERVSFSQIDKNAFIFIQNVEANPLVSINFNDTIIHSHLIGLYNANNINAAITIGKYFKISSSQIKEAIESYIPENNRSQLLTKGTNEIILDAYNANPSSMKVAIENFIQLTNENKVIIIGDMFELGKESLHEHKEIIALLLQQDALSCYFIGKDFYSNKIEKNDFHFYQKFEDFSESIVELNFKNSLILIKGSRGMALERTLDLL